MIPAAAVAVIEAALDDAERDGVRDPRAATTRAIRALADAGWTITPSTPLRAPQTGVQAAA